MANIALIAAELTNDPLVRGYSGMSDEQVAGSLNAVNRTKNLASFSGDELFAATDGTEFAALTDAKKQLWVSFCGRDSISPFGASNVAFVQWVFGGGSTTVSSLSALRTETVSRAVELGIGFVSPGSVQEARG